MRREKSYIIIIITVSDFPSSKADICEPLSLRRPPLDSIVAVVVSSLFVVHSAAAAAAAAAKEILYSGSG